MASSSIVRLIVGLGNPGNQYASTRHNVGAWFVEQLAADCQASLQFNNKFHGKTAAITLADHKVWLLLPTTFMNASGQAVHAFSQFYEIAPEEILVAHDELDFAAGVIRLKQNGGHGGHNGLRDIISHLHTDKFNRLRIGIGHPGQRHQVHDYVLSNPNQADRTLILDAIQQGFAVLPELIAGHSEKVMLQLHT